ncbi:MAG: penicillin-binding protein 2 [Micrococcaceae bacterium]
MKAQKNSGQWYTDLFNRAKKAATSAKPVSSRIRFKHLAWVLLAGFCILSIALLYLQGFDRKLAQEAQERRISKTVIPAKRGQILDSNGKVLAENVTRYDIVVTPKNVDQVERTEDGQQQVVTVDRTVSDVAGILGMSQDDVRKAFEGDTSKPMDERTFAYVKKDVDPATKAKIDALKIPWLGADETSKRVYPFGQVAGNVVGFTNNDGPLAGIEQSQDDILKGTDGERTFERGADGIRIATAPTEETPAVDGKTVKLTLNADIQAYAQQAAAENRAKTKSDWVMITVLDIKTGKVVAMAADQTVDPNNPEKTDEEHRYNRNVSEVYEPGSVAKQIFAAASMQEGYVEPDTRFVIPYTLQIGNQLYKDSHVHADENVTVAGILSQSSNTGTLMMDEKLTTQQRVDYLTKFGFGQPTGIELPGESGGVVHKASDMDDRTKQTILFGQGFSTTSLQMTESYATLANNGVRIPPRIVESVIDENGHEEVMPQPPSTRVVSDETADKSRKLLESVVADGGGHFAKMANYRMGGKTGTAEAASKDGKGFDGSTSSFIGVAPMDNPRFVINATFQRPVTSIWGEQIAAPVVKDVMEQTLQTYAVPASTPQTERLAVTYDGSVIN